MVEPDPKKIAFLRSNKDEISKMVMRENRRRAVRNIPSLSDDEMDIAITEMMSIVADKQRLGAFKFPNTGVPIEPQKDNPHPQDQRQPKRPQSPNNSYSFEAVGCANGFLLNVASAKGPKSFIFKTEDDLMVIFRETVFAEFEKLKAKKEEVTHV